VSLAWRRVALGFALGGWVLLLGLLLAPFDVPDPFRLGAEWSWTAIVGVAAVVLVLLTMHERTRLTPRLADALLAAYALLTVAGLFWSKDLVRTQQAVAATLAQLALFFGARRLMAVAGAAWPIFIGSLVAWISLDQLIALTFHVEVGLRERPAVYPRPDGWNGYPELGFLAVVAFGVLLGCLQASRRPAFRAAILVLIAATIAEIALLFSRLAWISTLALIVIAVGRALAGRSKALAASVALALLVGTGALYAGSAAVRSGVQSIGNAMTSWGEHRRTAIWSATVRMIEQQPWTGIGLGAFAAEFQKHYRPPDSMGVHAHNLWLHRTAELGIIGGLVYIAIWIVFIGAGWRALRHGDLVTCAIVYATIGMALRSLGDNMFYASSGAPARLETLTWLLFAGISAFGALQRRAAEAPADVVRRDRTDGRD
jgi:O-antigen ligase